MMYKCKYNTHTLKDELVHRNNIETTKSKRTIFLLARNSSSQQLYTITSNVAGIMNVHLHCMHRAHACNSYK